MKKLVSILAFLFLAIPTVAFASPVSWDFSSGVLQPLQSAWSAVIKGDHFVATSTATASTFPYASTTALSATSLCLSTDCRTAWPTGMFPFTAQTYGVSTSTTVGFLAGLFSVGSTTIGTLHLNSLSGGMLAVYSGLVGSYATTTAGTGLAYSGGAFNLANTAVTPGSYTNTNLTVDAQGRITAASNGSSGSSFGNNFTFVAGTPNYLIGTTSPLGLIMTASSTIGNSTQTGGLTIDGGATTTGTFTLDATNPTLIFNTPSSPIAIRGVTNAIQFGTPAGSGNVRSEITGNGNFSVVNTGSFQWTNSATNPDTTVDLSLTRPSAGVLSVNTNNASNSLGTIRAGIIGIGTTSPARTLSVQGSSYFAGALLATSTVQLSNYTNGLLFADGSGNLSSVSTSTWTFASSTLLANNNTFSGTNVFSSTITGSVSGNAGTATALQNARNINGTSFNGTADITITAASSTLLANNNTFSGSNTFSTLPTLGTLSGIIKGSSGTLSAAANGTDYTLITANTCGAGNHVSAITAAGVITCSADSGATFGKTFEIDASGWLSPTTSIGINAPASGPTYGFAIGDQLVGSASSTNKSTIFGLGAGNVATTSNINGLAITAFGYHALNSTSLSGTQANAAFGDFALEHNTTGTNNNAFGHSALDSNITGINNVAVGTGASGSNLSATSTTVVGAGGSGGSSSNFAAQGYTVVGYSAGWQFATGADYNTLFGYQAGYGITSGSKNIYLGAFTTSGNANVSTGSNNIIIGNDAKVPSATLSNQLNIQNILFGANNSATGIVPSTGTFGVGSTTPWARFSIHANNGDTNPILFAIGSSTASVTTTLFAINNVGSTTLGNFGTCNTTKALTTDSSGNIVCGTISSSGVSSVTATWPVISSGGTTPNLTWGGLATSSNLTSGRVHYSTGVNTFADVATSSIANGTGISVTNGSTAYVLGAQPTITNTGVISGTCTWPLTCSGTNPLTSSWSGLASSTNIANTQVLFATAANTYASNSAFTFNPTGVLLTATNASTTAATVSGFLGIPNSTSQGSTVAGAFALDTTDDQLKAGDGSATSVFDQRRFLTFTYATSTTWTGTTTLPLGTAPAAMTWKSIQCYTNVGTVEARLYYGPSPTSQYLNASTTINTNAFTSNNTPSAGATTTVDLGNPASSPTSVSCTLTAYVQGT